MNLDIVALSETRISGEGQLREEGGGYTFFWRGCEPGAARQHGVGFAVKNSLLLNLMEYPTGINERLMTLRLDLEGNQHVSMISAYAPTLSAEQQAKELFYAHLDTAINAIQNDDKIILLGDFNARVGRDHNIWRGTIGKEGVGNINSNGIHLLSKCVEHDLVITNTLFRQKNKLKTTWQHPRSKHWHLIDYVIVRSRDRRDVLLTRSAPGTEDCWTDHRLVYSHIKLKILSKKRNTNAPKRPKFDVESLQDQSNKLDFQQHLARNLDQDYPPDVVDHWSKLKEAIITTCEETVGVKKYKHQDWFDQNDAAIQHHIQTARKCLHDYLNDTSSCSKKKKHREAKAQVQRATREMKNKWLIDKSKELQSLFDKNDLRGFFSGTRAIYGPCSHGLAPLRSKDGTQLLKTNSKILDRWKEHFEELLNRNPVIDQDVLEQLPRHPIDTSLEAIPTLEDVEKAILSMKNNKASGPDNIPAEIFKYGGPILRAQFHLLIQKIWDNEEIPRDLVDGIITTIYKKKGDRSICGNYRGITLLSAAGKILAKILSTRLTSLAENILPESQCGFRPGRGTADMIFTARQIQEKCREQRKPLYMGFIDLTKAFDSINRELLWEILSRYGCPPKFINILKLLHDNMSVTVIANGNTTQPFKVTSGVKQGCVIAPTLFSVFIAVVLELIGDQLPQGITINYRTEGGIFNLRRLNARTKISVTSIIELQYADDNAVCALTERELQLILNAFASAYRRLGLSVNVRKTQIVYQPAPNEPREQVPNIRVSGESLEVVNRFAYLGSHLSSNTGIEDEVQYRLRCASLAFGKLRKRVFDDHDIRTSTKIKVYQAVVLPTLLYGSETWTTYRRNINALEKFHQRSLRSILKITWEDRRTNTSILEEAHCTSIEAMLINNQLRWAGHVVRMADTRLPKQIFYSELSEGTRSLGKPKKRYKDNLKDNMKLCELDIQTWEADAQDRTAWRAKCRDGVKVFEINRKEHQENLRAARIARRDQPRPPLPHNNVCPNCNRLCGSRIGLISHMRKHV